MCPTSEQAQTLVDLAKEKGLVLSVYQNRRWDGDFLTVKKLLKEGTVSDLSLSRLLRFSSVAAYG